MKTLVAFFSLTGTTASVAEKIAEVANGDLYKIVPKVKYREEDLTENPHCRAYLEGHDNDSRPAIEPDTLDIDSYDHIFIGFPIWWYIAPRVIYSFIDRHLTQLKGKPVFTFATSYQSTIEKADKELKITYPQFDWKGGKLFDSTSIQSVKDYIAVCRR